MRFKNININRSSTTFSGDYGKILNEISLNLNRIGDMFDIIARFENFILKDITPELEGLIKIRLLKDEIIENGSIEIYIKQYFKPSVDRLNEKISISISSWNQQEEFTLYGTMNQFVDKIKTLHGSLNSCSGDNCELQDSVKNIIELFSNFKVYHALTTSDPVERIEILITLKDDYDYVGEKKEIPKNKITIDDL
jgi:hypothetical protein